MERLPEFIANHLLLSIAFVALLTALIVTSSRNGGRKISPALLGGVLNRDNGVLLDVRADSDFRAGHIAGSVNIPAAQVTSRLAELEKYKGRPVVVVCNLGNTAGDVVQQLRRAGHTELLRLDGGITAWRQENLPVIKA